jgi:hypothetical protein
MSKSINAAIVAAVIGAAGAIAAAVITSHGGSSSTSSSTPNPSPTYEAGVIQTVNNEQYDYLYSAPTPNLLTDRVGEMSNGTNVQIICTVEGPAVANGDTLWDKVVYNSGSAYISDYYVYTGSNQALMPACP